MLSSAFLRNRTMRVWVGTQRSKLCRITRGVPQGAVLSPLLFLVFINGIVSDLSTSAVPALFADDTALLYSISRKAGPDRDADIARINADLATISAWCHKWRLSLAPDKTNAIILNKRHSLNSRAPPTILLNNVAIQWAADGCAVRYLGVWIDRTLSLRVHVAKKIATARLRLNVLRAYAGTDWGSSVVLLQIYKQWIRPALEYCASCMLNLSQRQCDLLQQVQNEALRAKP